MKKRIEINTKCAERLKYLLLEHKTTQIELCKMTDISMNTISKICNKKSPLTPYVADKIVKCFPGTRYEWLMGNSEFETDLLEQGYKAFKPIIEKRMRENAVYSFFESLNLSFSLNTPKDSPLNKNTKEFLSEVTVTHGKFSEAFKQFEDIIHSPNAYIIKKDGEVWGYCSEDERKALFAEIFDFAEFSLLKLCNREGQDNG